MESASANTFKFILDPAGKEFIVFLTCAGIATGSYSLQFELTDQPTQNKEGNIENPSKYRFAANAGIRKVRASVKSVSFLASDPGSYQVIVEQAGGNRLETPALSYSAQPEIVIETGSA